MKTIKLIILSLLAPIILLAEEGYIYFVVDGSASMSGVSLQESKDAMTKMAKYFFNAGQKISLVVPESSCGGGQKIATKFFASIQELEKALKRIKPHGGDNIPLGFEYAQEEMKKNHYTGHIYIFGDCNGLESCNGIKNISTKYKKLNSLTPFTYLGVDGCNKQEKLNWKTMLKEIGAKTGVASIFDYKEIISKKNNIYKEYFKKIKFLNTDATENQGSNFNKNPWRCIESDGLLWLAITKKEQELSFFITKPKNMARYKNNHHLITTGEFIEELNSQNTCGKSDWRLPDNFELSRLTQLGVEIREEMFPYINIWAHISSTGGKYNNFKKGVDLNDGKSYDYKEDRLYSAIFVSGDIDKTLFIPPNELLDRYKIITPPPPPKKCTASMVQTSCTMEECIAQGECNPTVLLPVVKQPTKKCTASMVEISCTMEECIEQGECR